MNGARQADIGVITGTPVELSAVRDVLDLTLTVSAAAYEGTVHTRGTATRVAALRAAEHGSTAEAFARLAREYAPEIVILTGVAEALGPQIAAGDVAVATEVAGAEQTSPAAVAHAVSCFFTDYGDPARFHTEDARGVSRGHRVLNGTVTADPGRAADGQVLAVDPAAGDLARAFRERAEPGVVHGWAVVRGIGDDAYHERTDAGQATAAWHAAAVLRCLIPYFRMSAR
ncbi:phosphorylase family protein [Acrocarpospora phusangensis]|uniref:phosphorylase family protein n=1 Tax=Acrocarpospora phusangensis TaxID=1070424 RepID=UPI00194F1E6F|nr:hypothetical protein [Acrocarpospora phusangensis]